MPKQQNIDPEQATLREAVLDTLSDGQWYPFNKILRQTIVFYPHLSSFKPKNPEYINLINTLVEEKYLLEGNNESYRFNPEKLELWRISSRTLNRSILQLQPRYFGGVLEDEGWLVSPLKECSLVYFKAVDLPREVLAKLAGVPLHNIEVSEHNYYKVYSLNTLATYDSVLELKRTNPEYEISGVRKELNLYRRDINSLDGRYLSDLCRYYGKYAKILLRRHMSSIKVYIPEDEDITQQIYLWILEAVRRYNAATSIPFAAYLSTMLDKWVYDLGRKLSTRLVADKEIQHTRALNSFMEREQRKPSPAELAEELNMTAEEFTKDREILNTVQSLRSQGAIEQDGYELPLKADDPAEEHDTTLISQSIVSSSKSTDGTYNIAGLVSMYYAIWGDEATNKKVLSTLRANKIMKEKTEEIKKNLARILVTNPEIVETESIN